VPSWLSLVLLVIMFFARRAGPVATFPSALWCERLIARCKLGALVSAGAATFPQNQKISGRVRTRTNIIAEQISF
jgi:hypothetical protein